MLTILRVGIVGDDMMDVHLSNGNIVMLDLRKLCGEPAFASLLQDDRLLYPKTDGNSVYWREGPRLVIKEILQLMQKNDVYKED